MLVALALTLAPSCFVVDTECRPYLEESVGGARQKLVVTLETAGRRFVVKKTRPKVSETAMQCLRYSAESSVPTTTEKRTVDVHFFGSSPRIRTSAPNIRPGGLRGDIEESDQDIVCSDRALGLAAQISKACLDNENNRGRGRIIVDWRGRVIFEPPHLAATPEGKCAKEQVRGMESTLGELKPLQLVAYAESGAILYEHEQTVDKCDAVLRGLEGYEFTLQYYAEQDDVVPTYAWMARHLDVIAPCFASREELARSGYAIEVTRDRSAQRFTDLRFVGKSRPSNFRAYCIRQKLLTAKLPSLDGRYQDVVIPISGKCLRFFEDAATEP